MVDSSDDAIVGSGMNICGGCAEQACHARLFCLEMRSVDCINGTSELSAGALLGWRTYDGLTGSYVFTRTRTTLSRSRLLGNLSFIIAEIPLEQRVILCEP
jgi:hypothetical protein